MKFAKLAIASLVLLACWASYAKAPPKLVDFDRLYEKPDAFDRKLVRVRGFLSFEPNPHDVWAIWFYSSREQAVTNPKVHILISLKGSHLNPGKPLKSGRVEITARVVALPVRGGKHTPVLTEIRRVDELPVEGEHSP
jgi:hypothetical protein